jgi:hypothetical protein
MQLWSNLYLSDQPGMLCLVEERIWLGAQEEIGGNRLIAEIQAGDKKIFSAIGSPLPPQEGSGDRIFAPSWILDQLGVNGSGEDVRVRWRSEEFFPEATRLVLRPHDSAFYHADAKEELERALTLLGVLQAGTTITVPLDVLGGYEIQFDVLITEPADLVLMQGDEVVLEFEEALDGAAEAQAPIVTPALKPRIDDPIDAPMVPLPLIESDQRLGGQRLGGETRRMVDGRSWNPWR